MTQPMMFSFYCEIKIGYLQKVNCRGAIFLRDSLQLADYLEIFGR